MTNKPSIVSLSDDDFGFTIVNEEELTKQHSDNVEELTERLQKMYDAIMPLIRNLSKNPEQDIIKWPNRQAKLAEFKNKLETIGGGYIKGKSL